MIENPPILAVIGGSGLYSMPGLQDIQEYNLTTPFGNPSAPIVVGTLQGMRTAFLARHGYGHHISPTEVNYAANIYALKSLGVSRVVSISACGSLREDYAPGDLAIPDQLFDLTRDRRRSFFGDGFVVHIGVADPFCPELSAQLLRACQATGAVVHPGGCIHHHRRAALLHQSRIEHLPRLGDEPDRHDHLAGSLPGARG